MRILLFLVFSVSAMAQNPGPVYPVTTDPVGNTCGQNVAWIVGPSGAFETCKNGVVTAVGGAGGGGTVTNVATTGPITGGAITTTGTIACPTCATTTNGGALSGTAPIAVSAAGVISGGGLGTVNGALKGNGSGAISQSDCAGLSNASASCSTDATNASNISSGTLAPARIPTSLTTATPPLIISSATTIYVCPVALANCAYNGDGGQAATPSDSNTYAQAQNKATPFATVTHAAAVLANALLLAPMTVQLADTSTSCYTDSEVAWNQQTSLEGNPYQIFEIGWSQVGGPYAYTDTYPTSYLEIKGNITTPANVSWSGATVPCAGTTSGFRVAVRMVHMNTVVHGVNFKYFDANNVDNAAITAIDHSTLFSDHNTLTGSGGAGSNLALVGYNSNGHFGPANNVTEGSTIFCDVASYCNTRTPAGWFTSTVANSTFTKPAIIANENSHITIWGPTTQSYSGSAAYTVYQAQANGSIITVEAPAPGTSSITLNGANITFLVAAQNGTIVNGCQAGGNTCTLTSFLKHSNVSAGGFISDNVGTAGTSADTFTGGGQILYSAFSSPTGTVLSPTLKASVATNSVLYQTATNCINTASPAVCAAAAAGIVQVAAAGTSLQINTTAVTANSRIALTFSTVGITAPTNVASLIQPYVSAITGGSNFTITLPVAPLTNPVNITYTIVD